MALLNFRVDWQLDKGPSWYRKTKEYHGPLIFEARGTGRPGVCGSVDVLMQDEWSQLRNVARGIERWLDEKGRNVCATKGKFDGPKVT